MKKNLVIYHANCVDGFASAWAAWKFLGEEYTDYWSWNYGEHLGLQHYAKLTNTIVYIVDFSFSRTETLNICEVAERVIVLDHHKTAQKALSNWEDIPNNIEIVFDMERSGAGITWDYFSVRSERMPYRPTLIDYVEDRDLWRFALARSKEINGRIGFTPKVFAHYTETADDLTWDIDRVAREGELLAAQHQKFCEEIVLNCREININGHIGLACNCTPQFASEVGNLLAIQSGTYGATYCSDRTGSVKYSLRSIGEYDVSTIAKQFGGGGHKNAAGFSLDPNETDRSNCIKIWTLKGDAT